MEPDTRDRILEKAEELGRLIAQMPEFAYLQSAQREIGDDRESTEIMNRLRTLQETLVAQVGRGEKPSEEQQREYGELQDKIQGAARYQSLIAAQTNFDKLMERVHRAIGEGIRTGEESRIILPS